MLHKSGYVVKEIILIHKMQENAQWLQRKVGILTNFKSETWQWHWKERAQGL